MALPFCLFLSCQMLTWGWPSNVEIFRRLLSPSRHCHGFLQFLLSVIVHPLPLSPPPILLPKTCNQKYPPLYRRSEDFPFSHPLRKRRCIRPSPLSSNLSIRSLLVPFLPLPALADPTQAHLPMLFPFLNLRFNVEFDLRKFGKNSLGGVCLFLALALTKNPSHQARLQNVWRKPRVFCFHSPILK